MIYVIGNDKYIAAITNSAKQLSEWCAEHPIPEGMKIYTEVNYNFPLLILEFEGEEPEAHRYDKGIWKSGIAAARVHESHTIYKLKKPWKGQKDWSDYMGDLDHRHFGEDSK